MSLRSSGEKECDTGDDTELPESEVSSFTQYYKIAETLNSFGNEAIETNRLEVASM